MATDPSPNDEIFITGIAGAFPDCRSVHELQENLFNKVDLISDDERRWKQKYGVPQRTGKLFDIDKFDASFFNINYKRAHMMDPTARMLLEKTYEVIIDSGYNPCELRGQRVGVFYGSSFTEVDLSTAYLYQNLHNFGILSFTRSIFPVIVSDWLGVTGPALNMDTACSSAAYAIELAVKAIKEGRCDAAIAGGGNLCLSQAMSQKFYTLGVLSEDGRCKCFDNNANGYSRSEATSIVFLQKAKHSRRVYAKIIHAKTNCDGYKERGITYPAGNVQKHLLESFYKECKVSPRLVEYIEAHGTGTRVGDPEELNAIDEVFCTGRAAPLPIGSVKSNIGHTEPVAGICSLAKLVIAYHTGYIPPNIHYSTPREGVAALEEGRLKVVTEKQPWSRGLAAFSNFGFGGANAHVLLDNVPKYKVNKGLPSDDLPRLVCISGRTRSAVAKILDHLQSNTVDVDEVRLWHAIHEHGTHRHNYRGFILLASTPTRSLQLQRDIQHYRSDPSPVLVVYPGICELWSGMAKSLMKLPVFADTIQKCHDVVANNRVDLIKLVTNPNPGDLNNVKNCILAIVAVQIAFTEVLRAVAIKPNHIIGYGIGELSTAYVDNTLNLEQVILAAYHVGEAFNKESGLSGSAVSHLFKTLKSISSSKKIYAFVNNLQEPVKSVKIPENYKGNSIVIEVTPCTVHDFQNNIDRVSLAHKDEDGLEVLLLSLGKLFEKGLNPHLASIYPSVQFPVAQGTSMLSHLIEWNHTEDWYVFNDEHFLEDTLSESTITVSLEHDDKSYLAGHVIDGLTLFPATGYLELVWKSFANISSDDYTEISVVFENVTFGRATPIPKKGSLEFTISIHKETGNFEVLESDAVVVTGRIYSKKNVAADYRVIPAGSGNLVQDKGPSDLNLRAKDFYKELNLRGYQYKGFFCGMLGCNNYGTRGRIIWRGNWVAFLDAMLQPMILAQDTRSLYIPTRIEKLSIDVDVHRQILNKTVGKMKSFEFQSYPQIQVARISGVELRGLHVTAISKRPILGIPVYEKNVFVPNYGVSTMSFSDILRLNVQIVYESLQTYKFKCLEIVDEDYKKYKMTPAIETIGEVLADMPLLQADLLVVKNEEITLPSNVTVYNKEYTSDSNITLFVGSNLLNKPKELSEALATLRHGGFVMSREKKTTYPFKHSNENWDMITIHNTGLEYIVLLRKKSKSESTNFIRISAIDNTFTWIEEVKKEIEGSNKLVLYSQNEKINGLLGLINCLRKEPGGEKIHGLLIADPQAPEFNPNLEFYKEQLNKNLHLNVFTNGTWGTYRHLLLDDSKCVNSSHAYLNITAIGDLSSLRWYQGHYPFDTILKTPGFAYIQVYCSAMNFRDVMTALGRVTRDSVVRGRIAQECVLGMEVVGRTANGTRVMGMCNKGYTNIGSVDTTLSWPIPDEWSFAEAATIPVAYATVYASLVLIGKMRRGESILIHAGSGAVGQAAIWVALHYGLEVFTTVGTPAKREFIKKLFPQIQDDHIGNSRDTSFEDMIHVGTSGKGVHLILNSLADDKLLASVRCLARRGRFLEIGKVDITNNTLIEMYQFKKEITFHSVMLDYLFEPQNYKMKKDLQKLLLLGIASGAVRPLTYSSFDKSEIEQAFRYMAAGKHVGKIVIDMRDEEKDVLVKPVSHPIMAIPRYSCYKDEVYVLVGGLGGFGLELADWLVLRGARRLLLCSRRGVTNGYQAFRIRIWSSYGADVQVCTSDITSESGCAEMLNMANSMGQVKAVFNLAVVLKDAVFENQTQESFQQSFGPKALATIYLDKLTRKLCPELKAFVVFSSVSCGRGNAGQTNYGYSNSVMERICELRKEDGLPALAIQWGAVGDVGLVADMQEENIQIEIGGTLQQRIVSCLEAMDTFLTQNDAAIVSSIVVAEKRSGSSAGGNPVDAVAYVMGIKDLKTVSHQASLAELGMDSIMAVEIKQLLEREFDIFLSTQDIRNLTFSKLIEYSTENTKEVDPKEDKGKTASTDNNQTLKLIFKNLGDEEWATKSIVWLPTLVSETENINNAKMTLFMISGIENCASTLSTLCSKLKCRACVLQLGLRHPAESLDQMADRLYPVLRSQLSPGAPLYFLGYSFGTLVQLKLTAKFEKEGHKAVLICVDGGPEFINEIVKSVLPADSHNTEIVQVAILERIIKITSPNANIQDIMTEKVLKRKQFEEKVIAALEMFPDNMHYSNNYLTALATTVYNRFKLLLDNTDSLKELDEKLKSKITLIRTKVLPANVECSNDYGLGLVSDGEVTIHCLSEDHSTIIESKECANIINEILVSEKINKKENVFN